MISELKNIWITLLKKFDKWLNGCAGFITCIQLFADDTTLIYGTQRAKKKKGETVDGDKADIIYVFGHQFPSSQSQ